MLAVGNTISHYRIVGKIGSGGMGDVYKATDVLLGRTVALKFIHERTARDATSIERFRREARAISALNHPHICTIYEIGESEGLCFIAMELLEGQTLRDVCHGTALPIDDLLNFAVQIADALDYAHQQGVIHRDIKPENLFVTTRRQIKILDFGLAKVTGSKLYVVPDRDASSAATLAYTSLTESGATIGTLAYMSPEQARGEPIDGRTDIFSFGAVMYEMETGARPYDGNTSASITDAVLHVTPRLPRSLNPLVPGKLQRLTLKALQKDRDRRFSSAAEMLQALSSVQQERAQAAARQTYSQPGWSRRARLASLLLVVALALLGTWAYLRHQRSRWLHERALPEIRQLVMERKGVAALNVLHRAERQNAGDPELEKLKAATLWPAGVQSTPEGADVYIRDYADPQQQWTYLGKTPLLKNRLPLAFYAFRFKKDGYETVEATGTTGENLPVRVKLDRTGTLPDGMVRIPEGTVDPTGHGPRFVGEFLMDKFEVTNRQYKTFMDSGGYRDPKYWKHEIFKNGRKLTFAEAMTLFRDRTDRPGPSTWEVGSFVPGEEDYPVSGLSWYEAEAFAEFAGKSLPTVFHWYRAADMGRFSDILQASNFSGKGPAKVGSYPSLGPFGTYDMAGNVKEWCLNPTEDRRYILGGASTDLPYMYSEADARDPLNRSAGNGVRLVKYLSPAALNDQLTAAVSFQMSDYRRVKPVNDETFSIYRELYSYDKTPLNSRVESEDDSSPFWRRQRITFDAAYGGERVIAYLFLPTNAKPPYQTVVYFPHGGAQVFHTVEDTQLSLIDFIIKGGRALLFPIYKDTYERLQTPPEDGTNAQRDEIVEQSKDLRRSIDYLETRSDIDKSKLAFFGISYGAVLGPVMTALEPRFKAAVFSSGGCPNVAMRPEADPMNFAPRVKVPVLMINGRYDFLLPVETCQDPFFKLLGAPPQDKKHVLYDTGHAPPLLPLMKEVLNWLDRYLGPVS